LLLLGAVLASGLTGQGLHVAAATGNATAARQAAVPGGAGSARALPAVPVWRALGQDEATSSECDVRGIVESPAEGTTVPAGPLTISGWAADITAAGSTGIDEVRVSLDADPDQGGVPVSASYGTERADIAELLGDERFKPSGFALAWDSTSTTPGPHTLYVQVHSACGWTGTSRSVVVAGGAAPVATSAVTTPVPTATLPLTTPTPTATGGTLVFPTVPLVTPTGGAGAAAVAGTPAAPGTTASPLATQALTTATAAPSPTGSIPAPTGVTAAINPFDGAVTLSWTAPAAMVTAYLIVVNEPDGTQRPIRDAPGSVTRAVLTGLDPRIGYSLSVVAIDAFGRRGAPSTPVSTAGAPTVTPIPTPTLSPYCTPVPFGPPLCPPPGYVPGAPGYAGAQAYPGIGCPPLPGPFGIPNPACIGQPFGIGGGQFQLTATLVNPNTASLTWTGLPGATTYNVLQGINGQPPTQQVQSVGSATTAQVPIQPGTQYTFQIQAMGANNLEIGRSTVAPLAGGGIGIPPFGVPAGACGAPGQACASRSNVTVASQFAPMATGSQVTVAVRDAGGAPLPGHAVIIQPQRPGDQVQPVFGNGTTDPSGVATFTVRGATPGPATFNVTVDGIPLQTVTVTFQ
jgi:hypothetical protein